MAQINFSYDEGPNFTQTVRDTGEDSCDIYEMLDFLGHALRAAGFSFVDRVGISTERGEEKWGKF